MNQTIGQIIREKRTEKGMTQEQLAERLGVTGQAVSKWERDEAYPDIALLKELAKALGLSVGELLGEEKEETKYVQTTETDVDKMMLKICILSSDGDKVNINLPVAVIKALVGNEQLMASFSGGKAESLKNIDFKQILGMVSLGVMGKLVEISSSDGDTVEIWVE